jgi:hypothetical protein
VSTAVLHDLPMSARLAPWPQASRMTLVRCLWLAGLLHLWAVVGLGLAPEGTAPPSAGLQGGLNVTLRGPMENGAQGALPSQAGAAPAVEARARPRARVRDAPLPPAPSPLEAAAALAPTPAARGPEVDRPGPLSAGEPGPGTGADIAVPATAASAPRRLNLELGRWRGGELSRQGTAGVLPVLPRPPETDKLATEIEKAARADCRKAHAGAGLLAVVPLAIDAMRGTAGCKW